jgi:large conductance mechanosensitive channel
MKIIKEFKEFAVKGNMFDMAVGIIIGASFGKIVSSLVNDVIMPSLGFLIGRIDFKNLKFLFQEETKDSSGIIVQQLIEINYGIFIQSLVDFIIIAATIFLFIKLFNTLRRKAEDTKETSTPTPKNIQLLSKINDNLEQISKQLEASN